MLGRKMGKASLRARVFRPIILSILLAPILFEGIGTGLGVLPSAKSTVAEASADVERKVIIVQGLNSTGYDIGCTNAGTYGNVRTLVRAMTRTSPVTDHLGGEFAADDDILAATYFGYCQDSTGRKDFTRPMYREEDTCVGIHNALASLDSIVARYQSAEFDIISHSLGGFVAAYWISQQNTATRSRVHSIVTLDSPLYQIGS